MPLHRSTSDVDGAIWNLRPEPPLPLLSEYEARCTLHVRGVGGDFESAETLEKAFSKYGKFLTATIRHREDEAGNNTSWALVTMGDVSSAERALRGLSGHRSLRPNAFSAKAAATSQGAMITALTGHDNSVAGEASVAALAPIEVDASGRAIPPPPLNIREGGPPLQPIPHTDAVRPWRVAAAAADTEGDVTVAQAFDLQGCENASFNGRWVLDVVHPSVGGRAHYIHDRYGFHMFYAKALDAWMIDTECSPDKVQDKTHVCLAIYLNPPGVAEDEGSPSVPGASVGSEHEVAEEGTAANDHATAQAERAELEVWEIIQVLNGMTGAPAPEAEEASRLQARMRELQALVSRAPVNSVEQLFRRIDIDRSNSVSLSEMADYLQGRAAAAATEEGEVVPKINGDTSDLLEKMRMLAQELGGSDGEMDRAGFSMVLRELLVEEPEWVMADPTEADICNWLAAGGLDGVRSGASPVPLPGDAGHRQFPPLGSHRWSYFHAPPQLLTEEEESEAALKIQSVYRGNIARRQTANQLKLAAEIPVQVDPLPETWGSLEPLYISIASCDYAPHKPHPPPSPRASPLPLTQDEVLSEEEKRGAASDVKHREEQHPVPALYFVQDEEIQVLVDTLVGLGPGWSLGRSMGRTGYFPSKLAEKQIETDLKLSRAAVKLQATYRGNLARRTALGSLITSKRRAKADAKAAAAAADAEALAAAAAVEAEAAEAAKPPVGWAPRLLTLTECVPRPCPFVEGGARDPNPKADLLSRPTPVEVAEHALHLLGTRRTDNSVGGGAGGNLRCLHWLAEEALCAPLPRGWAEHLEPTVSGGGALYFRKNTAAALVQWEDPLHGHFVDVAHELGDLIRKMRTACQPGNQDETARIAAATGYEAAVAAHYEVLRPLLRNETAPARRARFLRYVAGLLTCRSTLSRCTFQPSPLPCYPLLSLRLVPCVPPLPSSPLLPWSPGVVVCS